MTAGALTVRIRAAIIRSAVNVSQPDKSDKKVTNMVTSIKMALRTTPKLGDEAARLWRVVAFMLALMRGRGWRRQVEGF